MTRKSDTPLFDWNPPCTVLVFPVHLDSKRVNRTAEVFSQKSGNDANSYYRRITNTLANRLLDAGVSEDEVNRQLNAFTDAVQRRLDYFHSSNPKENKDG